MALTIRDAITKGVLELSHQQTGQNTVLQR